MAIGSSGEWSLLTTESLGKGALILQAVTEFASEKEWCCPVPASQAAAAFYPMAV